MLRRAEVHVVIEVATLDGERGLVIVTQSSSHQIEDLVPLRLLIGLESRLPAAKDGSEVRGPQTRREVGDARDRLRIRREKGSQFTPLAFVRWFRPPAIALVVPTLEMRDKLHRTHDGHLVQSEWTIWTHPTGDSITRR